MIFVKNYNPLPSIRSVAVSIGCKMPSLSSKRIRSASRPTVAAYRRKWTRSTIA